MNNPYFIAEISSNHNNSLQRIKKLIRSAKQSGFDAVKFQVFKIKKLFHIKVLNKSKLHRDREKWELNLNFLKQIKKECNKNKIKLGFTPFYIEAVDILENYADFYKIASYELLWTDLIEKCAKKNKKLIISTGMANMREVEKAFKSATKYLNKNKLSLLHCVSSYPASYKQCNLSSISTLRSNFKCKVGWSDHTTDKDVINRAVNYWQASEIEMHFDIDGKGFEANAGHCWLPHDCYNLISAIRKNKIIDGVSKKKPSDVEKLERNWRADPRDGLRPLLKIRNKF